VYIGALSKLSYRPVDRAGRTRLLALCWIGSILVFFTFSTTQEYYSMPCYPAFALLLGCAMALGGKRIRWGAVVLGVVAGLCAVAALGILAAVRHTPTPGDISAALSSHPNSYRLSLGHMEDLTLDSFAYLRLPLGIAALAFLIGTVSSLFKNRQYTFLATAVMMVMFFLGAHLAMITFNPFLSSRAIAEKILASPPGVIIADHHYYTYSSIAFYTDRPELLLNGRWNNMEYGSNAPGAPDVFIDDSNLKTLWVRSTRYYLVTNQKQLPRLRRLLGSDALSIVTVSGKKLLITNHPFTGSVAAAS
jgi:hypothetical protein